MAWLRVHSYDNLGGEEVTFNGAQQIANLNDHTLPKGGPLNDNISSLEVGPGTWVTLWEAAGFSGRYENYFPGDAPSRIWLSNSSSSIRIFDFPPGYEPVEEATE